MSVGVMKDYKLKQRNLRASHTMGRSSIALKNGKEEKEKKTFVSFQGTEMQFQQRIDTRV